MIPQSHLLFLYKFPEDDSEVFMIYLHEELEEAKRDAVNFREMYPEVLYITIAEVSINETESALWSWANPQAEKLLKRLSNAGPASLLSPMISGFAPPVGSLYPQQMGKSSTSPLGARPPSEEQFDSPLPDISPTYGGRKLRRGRTRR
jgi:hypothetical protein